MTRPRFKPTTLGGAHRWIVASLAIVALAMAGPAPAKAASVQFATFQQTTGTPFEFDGALGTFGGVSQTKFNFTAASGLSTVDRNATITLSSQAVGSVMSAGGVLVQAIDGANVISIIENSTNKNLLTMVFNGSISGFSGSSNATLAGDTNIGNVIAYSSDYLEILNGNPASYLIGLPTVTPALSVGGTYLSTFVSNASGSFSANINAVPAPTSMAMFGTGIVTTLALAKRRKRLAELKSA